MATLAVVLKDVPSDARKAPALPLPDLGQDDWHTADLLTARSVEELAGDLAD